MCEKMEEFEMEGVAKVGSMWCVLLADFSVLLCVVFFLIDCVCLVTV